MPYVNDGDGMHTFTDPADDATYVAAYAGMDLAHRVFACFDQPDLKAPITLTVQPPRRTGPSSANGRETAREGDVRDLHHHAADLDVPLHRVRRAVALPHLGARRAARSAGTPGASLAAELDRDFDDMRRVTEACFDFYTATFDEPYPFDSYDQVMRPGPQLGRDGDRRAA